MKNQFPFRGSRGFTLVELLTVLAIIAILSAATVPAVTAMFKSPKIDQAMVSCTGALERARQYAVANNTYTWVAFYQDAKDVTGNKVYIAILASADGTDPTSGFAPEGASLPWTVPASDYILVNKITSFPQIALENAGYNVFPTLPTTATTPSDLAFNKVTFQLNVPAKAASELFNYVVQFSPAGEARVSSGLVTLIEIGLSPVKGASNSPDTHNVAVIRLAGMTGQATLYRP